MKKLFTIVLAAMLLLASVAYAETGAALVISNPKLSIVSSEKQMALDLSGLSLAFLTSQSVPNAYVLEVRGDDETLMRVQEQIEGTSRVLFALDGVTGVFSLGLPQNAVGIQAAQTGQSAEGQAQVDAALSAFDVNALVQKAMAGIEIDASASPMTFKAPYTTVNETLGMLLPMLENSDIPGVDVKTIKALFNEWTRQNSGYDLEGTYASGANGMSFTGTVIPVKDGTAGEPWLNLSFSTDDLVTRMNASVAEVGAVSLTIEKAGEGQVSTIAFNTDDANLTITADVNAVEETFSIMPLDTTEVIDVQNMTKAQRSQFDTEYAECTNRVFTYVFNLLKSTNSAVINDVEAETGEAAEAEDQTEAEVPAA